MEDFSSTFKKTIPFLVGISTVYWIFKPKTSISEPGKELTSDCVDTKFAEIIGDYLAHGMGGSVFRLPSGDVLKVVSLENDGEGTQGEMNREQAGFIEDLWLKKLAGDENVFISDFADIRHYNRGYANLEMVKLVNAERPESLSKRSPLKVGEKIAYWVMEYIPIIGKGEMSDARIKGGKQRIEDWGQKHGYKIEDLHAGNFGEREDGTFVAFDPWPTKLEVQERD
ncbi:hypothetical protein CMK18_21235 [Candidatus Poribacteria bacterium]|nr:hypothetical protein [Candidatus Poribacteria bacterium]